MIIAGGDSIVWGSELTDSPHGGFNGYSRNTFTALLAGNEYVCAAYPGINNYEISQRAKNNTTINNIKCFIICWTWPSRDGAVSSPSVISEFQNFCLHYQIPYLFTCVDNCLIELLNSKIDMDHWYLFPSGTESYETLKPRGFYQWAVENKYNIGSDGHPLEDAHRDAAELIKEKFNELVKKSI
jgi:hypothetical protein